MLLDLSFLLNNAYSEIILFILIFASSIIVVPEIELIVVSFAAFVTSIPGLISLIFLVLIASVLGDITIYLVTKKFSNKVEKSMKKFEIYSKNEKNFRSMFNRYGFIFVFITRFSITGAGIVLNYICGLEKMEARKFILAVILGQTIAALIYTLTGYIFKDVWAEFLNLVQTSMLTLLAFILFIFVIYRIIKYYQAKKLLKSK